MAYVVDVPPDVSRAMQADGRAAVVFTVDGSSPRKTTLQPRAGGGHRMHVHSVAREEVGAKAGDTVTIVLRRDTDPPGTPVPPDLAEALDEAGALETFRTMGPAVQRELVAFVENAKRAATRRKYVARVVERAAELREKRLDRARQKE